ncbi:hypothetical protein ABZ215_30490 [Amycolatopsis sp. NPDC006131]
MSSALHELCLHLAQRCCPVLDDAGAAPVADRRAHEVSPRS